MEHRPILPQLVVGELSNPVLHGSVGCLRRLRTLHDSLVLGEDLILERQVALLGEGELANAPFLDLIPLSFVDLSVSVAFAVVLEELLDGSAVGVSLLLAVL